MKSEPLWIFNNFVDSFELFGVLLFVFFGLLEQREPVERAPRLMERELVFGFAVVTEPRQRLRILIRAWQALFLRLPPVIRMDYSRVMEQISDRTNRVVRARMAYARVAEELLPAYPLIALSKNVTQVTRYESRSPIQF